MSTAAPPIDPVAAFNDQLAQARLDALRMLQQLMTSLAGPDAPLASAARELRLLATAILRTRPLEPADADTQSPLPEPTSPAPNDRPATSTSPAPRRLPDPAPPPVARVITAARRILRDPTSSRASAAYRLLERHAASVAGLPGP